MNVPKLRLTPIGQIAQRNQTGVAIVNEIAKRLNIEPHEFGDVKLFDRADAQRIEAEIRAHDASKATFHGRQTIH